MPAPTSRPNDAINELIEYNRQRGKHITPEQATDFYLRYLMQEAPHPMPTEPRMGEKVLGALAPVRETIKGAFGTPMLGNFFSGLANPTDIGQMAGTGAGLAGGALLGGPPGAAIGALLGGGLGRMGGSMLEAKPDPFVEGGLGLLTGLIPSALKGGSFATRVTKARHDEGKVVQAALDQLNEMLPSGAPKLAKDVSTLQRQVSATGKDSLIKWSKDKFQGNIDQINSVVGDVKLRLPSLGDDPISIREIIESVSGKGARLVPGQAPTTPTQKLVAVGRAKVLEEFEVMLEQGGMAPVARAYAKARNDFAKTNDIVRLLTQVSPKAKSKGIDVKRPLDLRAGNVDLAELQSQLLATREVGGLGSFSEAQLRELENVLGRGVGLAGVDRPLKLPFISIGGSPSSLSPRAAGLSIGEFPRAAGVRYTPPSAGLRLLGPPSVLPSRRE